MRRRYFIKVAGLGLGISLAPGTLALADKHDNADIILSAASDHQGRHYVTGIDHNGQLRFKLACSYRAHGSLLLKEHRLAVFFSRRPGLEMLVVDIDSGELRHRIIAANNRHYFGHGCLSLNGRQLYVTENAFDNDIYSGHGVIGIYDITASFRRIGEFNCQGIGPHQIERLPSSNTLVVAMGGILTHPNRRREKLNLDTMVSGLHYFSGDSGTLLAKIASPKPQLSLRHLRVDDDDTVVVGGQYQGDASELLPLVFQHHYQAGKPVQELLAFQADEIQWLGLNQYIASVATEPSHRFAITTAPRGNSVDLWSLEKGQLLHRIKVKDVAGAIWLPQQQGFLVSNGSGELTLLRIKQHRLVSRQLSIDKQLRWDNHLFG